MDRAEKRGMPDDSRDTEAIRYGDRERRRQTYRGIRQDIYKGRESGEGESEREGKEGQRTRERQSKRERKRDQERERQEMGRQTDEGSPVKKNKRKCKS